MLDPEWYHRPLDFEDIIAGGSLILIGTVSITISLLVSSVMWRQDKMIIGYRFLCSASVSDIMLLFNYGIWPGLTILFKSEIICPLARHWLQIYLDWAWFSMVWHFSLVGWSRWSAIRRPLSFRNQSRQMSYSLCLACYLVSLIQVLSTHFQPWYVTFYYEPSAYGMLAENFALYMSGGQSAMFLAFHVAAIVPPIVFYTWAVIYLIYRKKSSIITSMSSNHNLNNIEKRLMLPCIINLVVFVVGQLVITYGTGEGKWAGWTVMFLFCSNSAVNPILLIICSSTIRTQLLDLIGLGRMANKLSGETVLYQNPMVTRELEGIKGPLISDTVIQHADSTESVVYV